jgi:hypothetical protein
MVGSVAMKRFIQLIVMLNDVYIHIYINKILERKVRVFVDTAELCEPF